MATKKKAIGLQRFPVQILRNSVATVTDGTPVYDPINFDLQYEANEAARLYKLKMWLSNTAALDDPPTDGVTRVRAALLDDPNAVIDIATATEFDSRPEIVAYHEVVWSHQVDAAPAGKIVEDTCARMELEFPDGGMLVGRNMQYTVVVDETGSLTATTWELRAELWFKKERVSDAMFKQLMYGVRF